eukprot:11574-Heterococcus_DN1.PRE.3
MKFSVPVKTQELTNTSCAVTSCFIAGRTFTDSSVNSSASSSTNVHQAVSTVVLAAAVSTVVTAKLVVLVSTHQYGSSGILPKKAKLKNMRPPSFMLSPSFSGCCGYAYEQQAAHYRHYVSTQSWLLLADAYWCKTAIDTGSAYA